MSYGRAVVRREFEKIFPLSINLNGTDNTSNVAYSVLEPFSPAEARPTQSMLPQPKPTKMLKLQSPTTAEVRNLKMFTATEIENGRGKEPEYRKFWNKKVQDLSKNRNISNKEIYKRVNESWQLHRCKLLQVETRDVQTKSKEIENMRECEATGSHESKMKKTTLTKNVLGVREASEAIKSLAAEVTCLSESLKRSHDALEKNKFQNDLKHAKTRLDASRSELRKAQDTLRKNLGVKKSELFNYSDS